MDTIIRLSIIFFCISIFLLLSIVILFRLFKKKLIRYPDQFYYYSLCSQIFCSVFLLCLLILAEYDKHSTQSIKYLFLCTIFCHLIYIHYILVLNIEIYKKISRSLTKCSKRLKNIYHSSVLLISLSLTIAIYFVIENESSLKVNNLCYLVLVYYMAFISLILWVCTFYLIRKKFWINYKNLLSLVIASTIISISTLAEALTRTVEINDFRAQEYYTKSQVLLYSIDGILQGMSILCNRAFRKTIRGLLILRKEKTIDSLLEISQPSDGSSEKGKEFNISLNAGLFSDLFDNITKIVSFKKTLIKILISSSLFFSKNPLEVTGKCISFNIQEISSLETSINSQLTKSKEYTVQPSKLTLKQYKSQIFSNIKSLSPSTNNSIILSSLLDENNYTKLMSLACEEGGRSSSFVFLTADEKFIIKTIKKHERKLFIKKILQNYSNRISSGQSRLARIVGTFELVELKKSFIIMENILHKKHFSYIFDLKGSKVDRMVKNILDPRNPPTGVVLKDVNFDLLKYKLKLKLTENQEILKGLTEDFQMLKNLGIMDYSVLLGICIECEENVILNRYSYINDDGFVISVGVIDFFQEYSLGKAGEKTVKSVFNKRDEISSANPEEYFKRIVKMAVDIFK